MTEEGKPAYYTPGHYNPALDGLRALAIALVLARHSIRPFWKDTGQAFLPVGGFDFGAFLLNGWTGVDLFFVLSGYLITSQLLRLDLRDRANRWLAIRKYLCLRYFRIAPAYYLVLTVVCFGFFPRFPAAAAQPVWGWRYVYHLLFLNDYFPSNICVVFWSLAIEMKFYLAAPFLLMGLLRLPPRGRFAALGLLVAAVIALRFAAARWSYAGDDYNEYFALIRNRFHLTLDGLLAGMACALVRELPAAVRVLDGLARRGLLLGSGLVLFIGLTAFHPLLDNGVTLFDKTLLPACVVTAFALMLLGLIGDDGWGRAFFAWAGWGGVARLAFCLYLVHLPLLLPSIMLAVRLGVSVAHPVSFWLLTLPVFLGMAIVVALPLHLWVEQPAIAWSKRKFRI